MPRQGSPILRLRSQLHLDDVQEREGAKVAWDYPSVPVFIRRSDEERIAFENASCLLGNAAMLSLP
jgi:hypothetical protein